MNNRLVLGTAQLGLPYGIANKYGQVNLDDAKKILEYAADKGIGMLDTAIAYGDSEQRLGEIGVQDWQMVSKLPAMPEGCRHISQWVEDSVKNSLQRLRVKSLYGLLLHRPKQLLEKNGADLYSALLALKKKGLIDKIGVSIYDPMELDVLCSRYHLDIIQVPFNIFDRRLNESRWMTRLDDQATELHLRSIFLQGLLLMKSNERPVKFNRWQMLWSQWENWLNSSGLTPLQACIRYTLSFSKITKVIVGVDTLSQLKEIIQAIEGPLPDIPDDLQSNDLDLLNPSRWHLLT